MVYGKFLSKHVQTIEPSGIRKYFDLASRTEGAISLGVGEPDSDTPRHIREAATCSIESGKTYYIVNQGLLELCEEVRLHQKRRFRLDYDPVGNVIVMVGGSEAIDTAMRAIVDPGGEVILTEPSYIVYTPSVELTGAVPVHVKLGHEDQFKLTPERLKAATTPRIKAILMNFLSNPTGGVMMREDYVKLVPILKEHEIIVISDEVYAELTYDGTFCSPANFNEIKDQVIIISGFSKAYTMTGWRLDYVLADKTFTDAMNKIHQYVITSAPIAAQYGAIDAMRNGDTHVAEMRESYMTRRNFITRGFNRIGLPAYLPHGTLYIFPDIRGTGLTNDEFYVQPLGDQRVACVSGTAFGDAGKGLIRVSCAYNIDHTREAIERTDHFMEKSRQR